MKKRTIKRNDYNEKGKALLNDISKLVREFIRTTTPADRLIVRVRFTFRGKYMQPLEVEIKSRKRYYY